mmetsp:Transcript_99983/g.278470  ORF Transcript_99983/g.278470 Transcript_99983/m.278470 type:complete len:231 (-) Transcript_99983:1471-2163(-)
MRSLSRAVLLSSSRMDTKPGWCRSLIHPPSRFPTRMSPLCLSPRIFAPESVSLRTCTMSVTTSHSALPLAVSAYSPVPFLSLLLSLLALSSFPLSFPLSSVRLILVAVALSSVPWTILIMSDSVIPDCGVSQSSPQFSPAFVTKRNDSASATLAWRASLAFCTMCSWIRSTAISGKVSLSFLLSARAVPLVMAKLKNLTEAAHASGESSAQGPWPSAPMPSSQSSAVELS